jgi:periplasmic protein CpxP/Spy
MTGALLPGTLTALFNYSLSEGNPVMKPWIKRTLIGVFGASILIGGLSACGTGGHRGGHHGGDWSAERVTEMRGKVIDKISSQLVLNDAQKQKLGVLADEMIASRTAFRGKDADPRAELKAMVAGDKFDRTRAQALLDQKTQVVQGSGPKMIAAMADFYDSLNPAQQKQVREKMEHRGGWWGRG